MDQPGNRCHTGGQFHVALRVVSNFDIEALQQGDIVFTQLNAVAGNDVGAQEVQFGEMFNRCSVVAFYYLGHFSFGFSQMNHQRQVERSRQAEGLLQQLRCAKIG